MSDNFNSSSNYRQPYPTGGINGFQSSASARTSQPPVLPPRTHLNGSTSSYNYGSSYSPYGSSYGYGGYGGLGSMNTFGGLGGYGSYGGFGGYRPGFNSYGSYGPYGNAMTPENRFIQMAEQSARPAFESIQSVLGVLGSVTMMFESTFHAIHSSYSSVLGVADNFAKLQSMFGSVFSAFSVIRAFHWLYKRILYSLGLRTVDPNDESVWASAMNELSRGENSGLPDGAAGSAGWPTLVFLTAILAGPYLIFRLISKMIPAPAPVWDPRNNPGRMSQALFEFMGASPQELSFRRAQRLMIAPKEFQVGTSGWLLACDQSGRVGLIPGNYVAMDNIPSYQTTTHQPDSSTLQTSNITDSVQEHPIATPSGPQWNLDQPSTSQSTQRIDQIPESATSLPTPSATPASAAPEPTPTALPVSAAPVPTPTTVPEQEQISHNS